MPLRELPVDRERAVAILLRLLAVEGITGQEAAISAKVVECLREAGVSPDAMHFDDAQTRIPLPTPVGNLIVKLDGTRPGNRRLFLAHVDTVPLCTGVEPVIKGSRIVSATRTALGGDDRTGVAVLVTLAETLLTNHLSYPPLTLLFTVREESGLWGARNVNHAEFGGAKMGFNFDGRSASEITIAAVGAERWECDIAGRASHAGVAPEKGIPASAVAALAIADVYRNGWFGKVVKGKQRGTSNVGSLAGADGGPAGRATNVVTDFVRVFGESRSHDAKFAKTITAAYKSAFTAAAGKVHNDAGKSAKAKFTSRLDYAPFRLKDTAPVVRLASRAVESTGRPAELRVADGGLDANWLVKNGLPTVTLGAGQNNIHTVDEYVDVSEFVQGCRTAVALATAEENP